MQSTTQTVSVSKTMLWTGRVISTLPALMLLFAGGMKLTRSAAVLQGFAQYGYPDRLIVVIGALEVACTIVYLIPRLSVLGAILMTAFLGGATVSNVRIGNPAWAITVVLGILVWVGLYLRDARVRALIPLRNRVQN
ncbi:MAG TPA: DoxX family protein [Terriglobales bacterium]|nr:DoxX family protein [Terriglobales bacterium]